MVKPQARVERAHGATEKLLVDEAGEGTFQDERFDGEVLAQEGFRFHRETMADSGGLLPRRRSAKLKRMRRAPITAAVVLLAIAGCHRDEAKEKGWARLEGPPAPLASGWRRLSDAGSGLTMDLPPGWSEYRPMDEAFQQRALAAMKAAGAMPPGGAIRMGTVGSIPDLAGISFNAPDLQRGVGVLVEARHERAPKSLTLDGAIRALDQTGWGQGAGTAGALEAGRVQLAVGPAFRRVTGYASESRVDCRLITYVLVHDRDLYTVAFRVPAADLARLRPTMDAILATLRLAPPNMALKAQRKEEMLRAMRTPKPTQPVITTGPIQAPAAPDPYASVPGGVPNPGLQPPGGEPPGGSSSGGPGFGPTGSPPADPGPASDDPPPPANPPGTAPPPSTGPTGF